MAPAVCSTALTFEQDTRINGSAKHSRGIAQTQLLRKLYSNSVILKTWKTATEHLDREVSSTAVPEFQIATTYKRRRILLNHSQKPYLKQVRMPGSTNIGMQNSGHVASFQATFTVCWRDQSGIPRVSSQPMTGVNLHQKCAKPCVAN